MAHATRSLSDLWPRSCRCSTLSCVLACRKMWPVRLLTTFSRTYQLERWILRRFFSARMRGNRRGIDNTHTRTTPTLARAPNAPSRCGEGLLEYGAAFCVENQREHTPGGCNTVFIGIPMCVTNNTSVTWYRYME